MRDPFAELPRRRRRGRDHGERPRVTIRPHGASGSGTGAMTASSTASTPTLGRRLRPGRRHADHHPARRRRRGCLGRRDRGARVQPRGPQRRRQRRGVRRHRRAGGHREPGRQRPDLGSAHRTRAAGAAAALPLGATGVAFSPDGRRLVTTWADGITRIWTLDLDELVDIARDRVTRGLTTRGVRAVPARGHLSRVLNPSAPRICHRAADGLPRWSRTLLAPPLPRAARPRSRHDTHHRAGHRPRGPVHRHRSPAATAQVPAHGPRMGRRRRGPGRGRGAGAADGHVGPVPAEDHRPDAGRGPGRRPARWVSPGRRTAPSVTSPTTRAPARSVSPGRRTAPSVTSPTTRAPARPVSPRSADGAERYLAAHQGSRPAGAPSRRTVRSVTSPTIGRRGSHPSARPDPAQTCGDAGRSRFWSQEP